MKKTNNDSPGERLRYLRKELLGLTQLELADRMGVNRSGIANSEGGKQAVSRQTMDRLKELFNVNPVWLERGLGEPFLRSGNQSGIVDDQRGMLVAGGKMLGFFLTNKDAYKDGNVPGRYGYGQLAGTKVRLHAARDTLILESELFRMVEDDQLWFVAGEPNGWEFEILREYFDYGGDRTMEEWLEVLRLLRWIRTCLNQSESDADVDDVRTA